MKTKKTKKESIAESGKTKKNASEKTHTPAIPAATDVTAVERSVSEKPGAADKLLAGAKISPGASRPASEMRTSEPMGIKKESVKPGNRSRVTFRLPSQAAPKARKVTIVGDFNNWNQEATPLRKMEGGDFMVTLELASGKEYRFRYLIDGKRWENDWHADKYVKSPFGVDDSVVAV
ncbi:MAG: isoamylase early set domain-containing protein [Nitrospiraceae bacterium]|nr:isoamylase early set domain-containing protein [Nitrospiraceae bacterium]